MNTGICRVVLAWNSPTDHPPDPGIVPPAIWATSATGIAARERDQQRLEQKVNPGPGRGAEQVGLDASGDVAG
ncbi:MAG: hypothetical protein M3Z75_30980 [Actinomycetota bacterium]|nr:hypothetical protein [Actinomycetota bacterium]